MNLEKNLCRVCFHFAETESEIKNKKDMKAWDEKRTTYFIQGFSRDLLLSCSLLARSASQSHADGRSAPVSP